MAFGCFLKIDGIPGESMDDKHKEWIELLSYSHEISQPATGSASRAGAWVLLTPMSGAGELLWTGR